MSAEKVISSTRELAERLAGVRAGGKRVVMCHGVFDLLHAGHMMHLEAARKHGDILVVTITPDRFVNKGPGRPAFNQRLRAMALSVLESVDFVSISESPTAVDTIRTLKPDFYVKGTEYADAEDDITGGIVDEKAAVEEFGGSLVFTDEETFSSSNLINRFVSPYDDDTQAFLDRLRSAYTPDQIVDYLQSYSSIKPIVVGEAILDEYCYTLPLAKAPREPIIAAKYVSMETFGGGGIATANHLAGFCDEVTFVGTIGPDATHRKLVEDSLKPNVNFVPVVTPDRPTIRKRRFVEPSHLTKLFEIQYLDDSDLLAETEAEAAKTLETLLPSHDLAVVNDFGHGFLTSRLRALLSDSPTYLALNTQTNSANLGFNLITKYRSARYCCIDFAESKLGAQLPHGDPEECGRFLIDKLNADLFMTTNGRNGATLLKSNGEVIEAPAVSPAIVDRVGAGDAFFAITSPWAYRNYAPELLGFIGNCVGALQVSVVGNRTPVGLVPLARFITSILK